MDEERVRVRAFAGGRVQGVAYRHYAEKNAERFGVTGWVRNLRDGRVEVLAEGSTAQVESFLQALRDGPRLAWVESFAVSRETATGEFADFRIVFFSG